MGLPNVSLLRMTLLSINLLIKIYKFKPILEILNRSISPVFKPQTHSVDDTCILDIIFIVSRAKIFRYVFIIRSTCSKGHWFMRARIDTNYLYQKASITTSNKKRRRKSWIFICICINLNNKISWMLGCRPWVCRVCHGTTPSFFFFIPLSSKLTDNQDAFSKK